MRNMNSVRLLVNAWPHWPKSLINFHHFVINMNITRRLSLARISTRLSYCAFVVILLINGIAQDAPASIHIFTLLPILIFLPGIIKEHYKSLSMLCFVCLMYFTLITVNIFDPNHNLWDILEMILVSILFTSAMFFSRWKQRSLYEQMNQSGITNENHQ